MNEINIFAPDSGLSMISESLFGIQDGRPAFVTTEGEQKGWNAVVDNPVADQVAFVPLDHSIVIHPTPETTYSLCDCMLYHGTHWLALVELKDQAKGWIEDAICQLTSTIRLIQDDPSTADFTFHEAYAANKQHPAFHFSAKSRMNEFRKETNFRLIITNRIKVK